MTTNEINKMYGNASVEEIYAAYKEVDTQNTNEYDGDNTPLHVACLHADSIAVGILLAREANPNIQNRFAALPLHLLAVARIKSGTRLIEGEVRKCAEQLFDARASVMRKNEQGRTPILEAAYYGCNEILEVAVEKGAKLTMTDSNGDTALHLVCRWVGNAIENFEYAQNQVNKLNTEKLQQLKAEFDKNPEDRTQARMYNMELERHTNAKTELNDNLSVVNGFYLSAKALLDGGLDPDEKNNAGKTPIDFAVENGDKRIGALLRGIDETSTESGTGGMTLHQAVIQGDYQAIKACATCGADMNAISDEDGNFKDMTPLAVACRRFDIEAVKLLLELGADPNFKDAEGRNALTRWFGWMGDSLLTMQHSKENIPQKIFKIMLAKGYQIDASVDDKSNTTLTAACMSTNRGNRYNDNPVVGVVVATELIIANANVNRCNADGQSPLMLINQIARGGREVANLQIMLLEADADVAAVDRNGNTPLHYAAMNTEALTGKEMAEMLFDFGDPKPDAVNNEGKSALEIATDNNNEPLVKLILMNS